MCNHLVYGGGAVGLMGELARTLCRLKSPGVVHGMTPEALVNLERGSDENTVKDGYYTPHEAEYGRTTIVPDMHTRKKLMAKEIFAGGPGSGLIGLPGGFGTIEELFEAIAWNQLGIYDKGIVLLNINDFWHGMLSLIDTASHEGFIREANKSIVVAASTSDEAIKMLREYKASSGIYDLKWVRQQG